MFNRWTNVKSSNINRYPIIENAGSYFKVIIGKTRIYNPGGLLIREMQVLMGKIGHINGHILHTFGLDYIRKPVPQK